MGRSSSLSVLLISALLLLSFSHGRKLMQTYDNEEDSAVLSEENVRSARVLLGYGYGYGYGYGDYPGANANTDTAGFSSSPPSFPSPGH